jgi:hypothetical protein
MMVQADHGNIPIPRKPFYGIPRNYAPSTMGGIRNLGQDKQNFHTRITLQYLREMSYSYGRRIVTTKVGFDLTAFLLDTEDDRRVEEDPSRCRAYGKSRLPPTEAARLEYGYR